jgi:putative ABC transport system substrate-binding protein
MSFDRLRRRDFVRLLGSAAATWPIAARAQQPALPVIGHLSAGSPDIARQSLVAFRQGLKEFGYLEGQNITIEYSAADGRYDRMPALAADLVRRRVNAIYAVGVPATLAAKTATSTIPIVFVAGGDPVGLGIVASFNRPGAQVTGINIMATALSAKRLELLRELLPTSTAFGFIANPRNPVTEGEVMDMLAAAKAAGLQLDVVYAGTGAETSAAFDNLLQRRATAAVVQADPIFLSERTQIASIASRHGMPSIYSVRDYVLQRARLRRVRRSDELWR